MLFSVMQQSGQSGGGIGFVGGNRFTAFEVGSNLLKTIGFGGTKLSVHSIKGDFEQGVTNNGFYSLADSMYLILGRLEGNAEFCLLNGRSGELTEIGEYPSWVKKTEISLVQDKLFAENNEI